MPAASSGWSSYLPSTAPTDVDRYGGTFTLGFFGDHALTRIGLMGLIGTGTTSSFDVSSQHWRRQSRCGQTSATPLPSWLPKSTAHPQPIYTRGPSYGVALDFSRSEREIHCNCYLTLRQNTVVSCGFAPGCAGGSGCWVYLA